MPEAKNKRKFKVRYGLVGLLILASFFAPKMIQSVRNYGAAISGEILLDLIRRESKSYYTIDFQRSNLSILERKLIIEGFRIFPDSANIAANNLTAPINSFEVLVSSLEINLQTFYELVLFKELKVEAVRIIDPSIKILRTASPASPRPFSLEAGDLYTLVSQYLKLFKIDYFQIQSGEFSYNKNPSETDSSNLKIGELDFLVENFVMDSASGKNKKLFFTDAIELVINKQIIYLSDSIHQFSFDKLVLSTNDELIRFEDIRVKPRDGLDMSFFNNPQGLNIYDITVPELQLGGVDFLEAYQNNKLNIEQIILDRPIVRIDDRGVRDSSGEPSNSLGAIVTDYFDEVSVKEFKANGGLLNIKVLKDRRGRGIRLENAHLKLSNFKIDSTSFGENASGNYFEDIDLNFENYTFNLPDSIHRMSIKNFALSTKQQKVDIDSIRVVPRDENKIPPDRNVYHITLPKLSIEGFNLAEISTERKFNFGRFELPSPKIRIETPRKADRAESREFSPEDAARQLLKRINQLAFAGVNITGGQLHFTRAEEELFGFENIDLDITNFNIDDAALARANDQLFFSETIDLHFRDFDIEVANRSQLLLFDQIHFNTLDQQLRLEGIHVKSIHKALATQKYMLSGNVERFILDGLEVRNILDHQHVQVANVRVQNPHIDLVENKNYEKPVRQDDATNWLKYLSIGHMDLNKGRLRLANIDSTMVNIGNIDLQVSDFSLDSLRLKEKELLHQMNGLNVSLDQVTLMLGNSKHQLQFSEVKIDQDMEILDLKGVSFRPQAYRNPQERITITTPDLALRGINLEEIIFESRLEVDSIDIRAPYISIRIDSAKRQSQRQSIADLRSSILEQFDLVNIGHLGTSNAKLSVTRGESTISVPGIDFSTTGFYVSPQYTPTNQVFFADQYDLFLRNPKLSLGNKLDSVSLKQLIFSTVNSRLQLDSLFVSSSNKQDQSSFSVFLPRVTLEQIDLEKYYDARHLQGAYLELTKPVIELSSRSAAKGNKDFPKTIEAPAAGPYQVLLDSIILDDLQIKYLSLAADDSTKTALNNINLLVEGFAWDSTKLIRDSVLFFSKNIHLDGKNISYRSPDSIYQIALEDYSLDSKNGNLVVSGLSVDPLVGRDELGAIVGHQTDWINGKIEKITFDSINLAALIFDRRIDIQSIMVEEPNFMLYRDKRLPFPENQFKQLPQLALLSAELPIEIDTINLLRGFIEYHEFAEDATQAGEITFENLSGQFRNIVNSPEGLSANNKLELNASTDVMGKATIYVNLYADLNSPEGKFLMDGKVESFELETLNPMLEHVAFVKIRSGETDRIEFNLEADNEYAVGEMKFYYDDLKISLISKKKESDKGMGPAIGSFFANTFVVNKRNPRFLFVRNGDIYFERDKSKSIFNYWTKSFLSGVVSSIGVGSNKKEIRKKNKEALKLLKEEAKEQKMLQEKVGVYE